VNNQPPFFLDASIAYIVVKRSLHQIAKVCLLVVVRDGCYLGSRPLIDTRLP